MDKNKTKASRLFKLALFAACICIISQSVLATTFKSQDTAVLSEAINNIPVNDQTKEVKSKLILEAFYLGQRCQTIAQEKNLKNKVEYKKVMLGKVDERIALLEYNLDLYKHPDYEYINVVDPFLSKLDVENREEVMAAAIKLFKAVKLSIEDNNYSQCTNDTKNILANIKKGDRND